MSACLKLLLPALAAVALTLGSSAAPACCDRHVARSEPVRLRTTARGSSGSAKSTIGLFAAARDTWQAARLPAGAECDVFAHV